jgi:propionyl-CoA carboxylase alpha chain
MEAGASVAFERDAHRARSATERFDGQVIGARRGGRRCAFRRAGASETATTVDWRPGEPVWRGTLDGVAIAAQVRPILNGVSLGHAGASRQCPCLYAARGGAGGADAGEGRRRIPARCCSAPCRAWSRRSRSRVGQEVKAGEPLAMVEAMKMENVLRAEKDVTIAKILAKEGDSLAVDAVIMEFA